MIVKGRERIPGWEERVEAEIASINPAAFKFGEHDCFQKFIAIEKAIYGSSLWEKNYGSYSSEKAAETELRPRIKTKNIALFIDRVHERVMPDALRLGDFSVRAFGFHLPRIYFFNGAKMVTVLPERSPIEYEVPISGFSRFWRL